MHSFRIRGTTDFQGRMPYIGAGLIINGTIALAAFCVWQRIYRWAPASLGWYLVAAIGAAMLLVLASTIHAVRREPPIWLGSFTFPIVFLILAAASVLRLAL